MSGDLSQGEAAAARVYAVASTTNLSALLQDRFEIRVMPSDCDLGCDSPYPELTTEAAGACDRQAPDRVADVFVTNQPGYFEVRRIAMAGVRRNIRFQSGSGSMSWKPLAS